jgi:UDP-glucose 4-epimerase
MTRFMMTLDHAVDLVLFAFERGNNGDIFVQKAPAATIGTVARAVCEVMGVPDHPVQLIGTRHGEKRFETLLSREERAAAEDLGKYFRVPPDLRDLNYEKFVERGEARITTSEDYHSHNTTRLDVAGVKALLEQLDILKAWRRGERAEED